MNDVAQLKGFSALHARSQGIGGLDDLLARIHTDEGDSPGSWVGEWSRAAAGHEARGSLLDACQHYNMARFPFVDGTARRHALHRCVDVFDRWRRTRAGIERLDVALDGGRVSAWATGLAPGGRRPLVLFCGGIVSIKEQWAPVLETLRRLGLAAIVTEMPGVGENTLPYTPESWRMLSDVIDAVQGRADTGRTYAVALSFSGHLALRCAVHDPRIQGIVTVGAPVRDFFTDAAWWARVPRITKDTLAHLTGTSGPTLGERLRDWALTDVQLGALAIPVHYAVSRRDEIIPGGDARLLRRYVRDLRVRAYDDVHGAPHHVTQTRLWTVASVLRMSGASPAMSTVLGALSWLTSRTASAAA